MEGKHPQSGDWVSNHRYRRTLDLLPYCEIWADYRLGNNRRMTLWSGCLDLLNIQSRLNTHHRCLVAYHLWVLVVDILDIDPVGTYYHRTEQVYFQPTPWCNEEPVDKSWELFDLQDFHTWKGIHPWAVPGDRGLAWKGTDFLLSQCICLGLNSRDHNCLVNLDVF